MGRAGSLPSRTVLHYRWPASSYCPPDRIKPTTLVLDPEPTARMKYSGRTCPHQRRAIPPWSPSWVLCVPLLRSGP